MNDFKIAAALLNFFFTRLISDSKDCVEIANAMKNKIGTKNDLERYLSDKIFKSSIKKLDSNDLTDFPQIDVLDIRLVSN